MSDQERRKPLAEPVEEEAPDAADLLRGVLQDERFEPGMIALVRQEVPLADDGLPAYVAEDAPTPLRGASLFRACWVLMIAALGVILALAVRAALFA